MNRLTKKNGALFGVYGKINQWIPESEEVGRIANEALEKLSAYEDTGLEPEQIRQLNDAFTNVQKKLAKAFDDLFEYKDLEEQGLLIKLPCKVGNMVFCVVENEIVEYIVSYFKINEKTYQIYFTNGSCYTCWDKNFDSDMKGIFLTREEAEKALEESEAQNDL